MAGFKPSKAMVSTNFLCYVPSSFVSGIFPIDNNDFQKLEESINRVGGFQLDL